MTTMPEFLQEVFHSLEEHIAVVDEDGTILAVNDAWRRFAVANGAPPPVRVAEGANYFDACLAGEADGEDGAQAALSGMQTVSAGKAPAFKLEYPCHAPDAQRWFLLHVTPLKNAPGKVVAAHIDITQRKRLENRMAYLAEHDPLTGLYNRRRFFKAFELALAHAQRYGRPGAVLLLDLDGFKQVNDTHGHAAGDAHLKALGQALRDQMRATDTLARLGGDEFAVLLPEVDESQARRAAQRARRAVAACQPPSSGDLRITCSVGGALYPHGALSHQDLLKLADRSLYRAKRQGKDRAVIAPPEPNP